MRPQQHLEQKDTLSYSPAHPRMMAPAFRCAVACLFTDHTLHLFSDAWLAVLQLEHAEVPSARSQRSASKRRRGTGARPGRCPAPWRGRGEDAKGRAAGARQRGRDAVSRMWSAGTPGQAWRIMPAKRVVGEAADEHGSVRASDLGVVAEGSGAACARSKDGLGRLDRRDGIVDRRRRGGRTREEGEARRWRAHGKQCILKSFCDRLEKYSSLSLSLF
ncbi:hypothetical protein L7F22_026846 [Adiantum nelumboides]|nr:hypothetical protein [Adiantum nelumboides]